MNRHIRSILLPILVALYPILFLYHQNAWVLQLSNIEILFLASLVVALVGYALFFAMQHNAVSASLTDVVLVVFYYLYGPVYQYLKDKHWFAVEHYVLLPLVVALTMLIGYGLWRVRASILAGLQKVLLVVSVALVGFNLIAAVPVEVQKTIMDHPAESVAKAAPVLPTTGNGKKLPDIYYILLDEYAGFPAIREYWHTDYVNQFETFLKDNNFYVAEGSRSVTINTAQETATKLNLQQYRDHTDSKEVLAAIDDNEVMKVVKSYGYTTVMVNDVFPVKADVHLNANPEAMQDVASAQFMQTFVDSTMLSAFNSFSSPSTEDLSGEHALSLIEHSFQDAGNLSNIPSPKFVYAHFLFPHMPFLADQNCNLIDVKYRDDWNHYLGQHMCTTKLAEQLIKDLLKNADPENPPVIILQSDHGARNLTRFSPTHQPLNGMLKTIRRNTCTTS